MNSATRLTTVACSALGLAAMLMLVRPEPSRVLSTEYSVQSEAEDVKTESDRAGWKPTPLSAPTIMLCQAQEELPPAVTPQNAPYDPGMGVQACGSACNRRIDGVDCNFGDACGETRWNQWGRVPWQQLGQGEYIGPPRNPDVPVYLVRVDDKIEFRYVATRYQSGKQYRIQAGDELKLESLVDPNLNRTVIVQPDGTITLQLLDQVQAARLTMAELTALLKEKYKEFYKIPIGLTVSPVKTNTRLDDLLAAVNNRFNAGGQGQIVTVAADGTISLTKIGKVPAQGLSLDELAAEVNARYADYVEGLETTPILVQRAPHYTYVLGDVKNGGRFQMDRPTTVMQALAMANGINNGGNLRQVVVFRRAEDWRLIATKLDIRGAVYGTRPTPADEIFLRDNDIVLIPKSSIKRADDFIELIMTNGFYRAFPIQFGTQSF
ncbi:MAG: polysaccharide biosynthesis/export family protein [Pirellulaceae bacterium]